MTRRLEAAGIREEQNGLPGMISVYSPRSRGYFNGAFDRFLEGVPNNRQVTFDDEGWMCAVARPGWRTCS